MSGDSPTRGFSIITYGRKRPETAFDSIVVGIVAIGFPITVVLTWMYKLTSDGLERDRDVADTDRSSGRVINVLVIGLLIVALGYFIWESRFQKEAPLSSGTETADGSTETDDTLIESQVLGRSMGVFIFCLFTFCIFGLHSTRFPKSIASKARNILIDHLMP